MIVALSILSSTITAAALSADDITHIKFQQRGNDITMNDSRMNTNKRYITDIKLKDGTEINVDKSDEAKSSLLYCMEPGTNSPKSGEWNAVDIYDDDTSGKKATLRKMVYYLPGGPGWNKTTKDRWYGAYTAKGGSLDAFGIGHIAVTYIYQSPKSEVVNPDDADIPQLDKTTAKNWIADLDNLPDPPDSYIAVFLRTPGSGKQDLVGSLYIEEDSGKIKLKKVSANSSITG